MPCKILGFLWLASALAGAESGRHDAAPKTVGRLVDVSYEGAAKARAQSTHTLLRKYLDSSGYDAALKKVLGKESGQASCTSNRFTRNTPAAAKAALDAELQNLAPETRVLARFLFGGAEVTREQLRTAFKDDTDKLLAGLAEQKVVEISGEKIRMNDLCVDSLRVTGALPATPLYLLSDSSKAFSKKGTEPEQRVEITSLSLLKAIEDFKMSHPEMQGITADLGSGGGIQGLALLKLYPNIEKVIALDIDKHGLNLSRMNAMLNGVDSRFEAWPNDDPAILKEKLKGKKLSFAVTNPPFNLVPESLGAEFSKFGYGGPDGLAITRILTKQAVSNLDKGGAVLVYSQFGLDKDGRPLFEKMLENEIPSNGKVNVRYQGDPLGHLGYGIHLSDVEEYAASTAEWLNQQSQSRKPITGAEYEDALKASGVHRLSTRIAVLERSPQAAGGGYEFEPYLEPFRRKPFDPSSLGGRTQGGVYLKPEGVRPKPK